MSFPGPISISPISNATDQEIGFRVNQRVNAQIVSVAGTTAILEVDGHPVVAQLTSADQAATLASRNTAQFIVTGLTSQSVTLKFVKNEQTQPALVGSLTSGPELAERILENTNLPVSTGALMVTRALLKQHLPVTPALLKELQDALTEYGDWGEADADLAAAMKSSGLPVTAQSLALAARKPVQTSDALSTLIKTLTQAAGGNLPKEVRDQLLASLQTLNSTVVKWEGESSGLADQLKVMVEALGRSLENILLDLAKDPAKPIPENSLATLMKLQQMLEQIGRREEARAVWEFLNDVRQSQFMNVRPDNLPGQGEWSEVAFMVQSARQQAENKFSPARLRVARESHEDASRINPAYTRLILQVDLKPGETVEVDLSLVGKQIRTSVMGPDPAWCDLAKNELPSLQEALIGLGYSLRDFQVGVGAPQPFSRVHVVSGNPHLMTVNIEV